MSRLPPTLLALALAAAFATAPAPALAQQVTTSKGARQLPRIDDLKNEARLRQLNYTGEEVVSQLLADIAAAESSRATLVGDANAITERAKREAAELQRAKAAFEEIDRKYREELAAFTQKQTDFDADVQRQRSEASVLEAQPSAQRDINEVQRINAWAAKIGTERTAIDTERDRLLAEHAKVEAERQRVAKQYQDAEAKLKAAREGTVGSFGNVQQQRVQSYRNLRIATDFLKTVNGALVRVAAPRPIRSTVLEQANAKLKTWEAATK